MILAVDRSSEEAQKMETSYPLADAEWHGLLSYCSSKSLNSTCLRAAEPNEEVSHSMSLTANLDGLTVSR